MTWEADYTAVAGEKFPYSTKQVNKAGDRLRRAAEHDEAPRPEDLALLNVLRGFHRVAGGRIRAHLVRTLHAEGGLEPDRIPVTARPLKTREAIIAKLVREKTRLVTMQDIAGARVIVPSLEIQDLIRQALVIGLEQFDPRVVKDHATEADALGYRAIHIVATVEGRHVEIQLRTAWQDAWAQMVEQFDGANGTDIKHGNAPPRMLELMVDLSDAILAADHGDRTKLTTMIEKLESGAHQ